MLIQRLAPDQDPAHVQAWIRLQNPALDAIDAIHFDREVKSAVNAIHATGPDE